MRTNYCNEINESQVDKEVHVCGWVNRIRDHGGVIFIDLRDIFSETISDLKDQNLRIIQENDNLKRNKIILETEKIELNKTIENRINDFNDFVAKA